LYGITTANLSAPMKMGLRYYGSTSGQFMYYVWNWSARADRGLR